MHSRWCDAIQDGGRPWLLLKNQLSQNAHNPTTDHHQITKRKASLTVGPEQVERGRVARLFLVNRVNHILGLTITTLEILSNPLSAHSQPSNGFPNVWQIPTAFPDLLTPLVHYTPDSPNGDKSPNLATLEWGVVGSSGHVALATAEVDRCRAVFCSFRWAENVSRGLTVTRQSGTGLAELFVCSGKAARVADIASIVAASHSTAPFFFITQRLPTGVASVTRGNCKETSPVVKRGEYGAAPERKGGGDRRSRENPLTSGIVRHYSHVRKSGSEPDREQNPVRVGVRESRRRDVPGPHLTHLVATRTFEKQVIAHLALNDTAEPRTPITIPTNAYKTTNFSRRIDVDVYAVHDKSHLSLVHIPPVRNVLDLFERPHAQSVSLAGFYALSTIHTKITSSAVVLCTECPNAHYIPAPPVGFFSGARWGCDANKSGRCQLFMGFPEAEQRDSERVVPGCGEDRGSIPSRVTPDLHMWESCWTMPLVGAFFWGSPVSLALSFRRYSTLTSITIICSKALDVQSRPNLFTHSEMRVKRCDYETAPECKGGRNGRPRRKSADQRHRPTRFPHAEKSENRTDHLSTLDGPTTENTCDTGPSNMPDMDKEPLELSDELLITSGSSNFYRGEWPKLRLKILSLYAKKNFQFNVRPEMPNQSDILYISWNFVCLATGDQTCNFYTQAQEYLMSLQVYRCEFPLLQWPTLSTHTQDFIRKCTIRVYKLSEKAVIAGRRRSTDIAPNDGRICIANEAPGGHFDSKRGKQRFNLHFTVGRSLTASATVLGRVDPLRLSAKQCWNKRAGGDPRENPPTRGFVRHDSQVRKSGSDSAGNRTRFALVLDPQVILTARAGTGYGSRNHIWRGGSGFKNWTRAHCNQENQSTSGVLVHNRTTRKPTAIRFPKVTYILRTWPQTLRGYSRQTEHF
ncbi:hypothetical protein PR048_027629 [Dryococelus australis]|uniref:Uncharacterized protein n=1 Tax=Dryococelus australis TaxID=614101 RepID=A0ABQ9GH17_9NEOP|nr:hypothetical protein PR048_027629 [Dryococelus australis]